jgi:lysophospholipase L1-like esterase
MRKIVLRTALLALSLCVGFGLAELLARLALPPPQQVLVSVKRKPAGGDPGESKPKERYALPHHPEEGFMYLSTPAGRRLRPNARVVIMDHELSKRRIEIETNSLGFRNREIGPKRGTRILFLGDSLTFGDYLAEEETFVRRVEDMARQDARSWETINAGVGAVSLQNELAILVESGLGLKPDVVALCFYLNDFAESPGVEVLRAPGPMRKSWLVSHVAQTLPLWFYKTTGHGRRMKEALKQGVDLDAWREEFRDSVPLGSGDYSQSAGAFNSLILERFSDWGGAWSPRAWEYMTPLFETLKRLSAENRFRLFVVAFPVRYQVQATFLNDFPQRELKRTAARLEMRVLDVLPVFRKAYAEGNKSLFYDHCHPTPEANEIVASAIYGFLSEELDAD